LYSESVVLLDAQIFDGAVLLELGPTGIIDMLSRDERVTNVVIALRHPTAAESLAAMRTPDFIWQTENVGWSPELVLARQQAWVDAIDEGIFPVTFADPTFIFAQEIGLRLKRSMPTQLGAVGVELSALTRRSEAHNLISRSGLMTVDQSLAFNWWDSAYMDTIALQWGASWMDSEVAAHETVNNPLASNLRISTPIPEAVTSGLARLSGREFSTLWMSVQPSVRRYYSKPGWVNRLRLGLEVLARLTTPNPVVELVLTVLRVVSWFFVVFAVVAPPTREWPTGVIILVAALAALVQIPLAEAMAIRRYVARSSRAFMRKPIGL
jgi:hypothetical protein